MSDLCNPMDCSPPVSSLHGISQAIILEWVAISFSRGSPQPRSGISALQVDSLSLRHGGSHLLINLSPSLDWSQKLCISSHWLQSGASSRKQDFTSSMSALVKIVALWLASRVLGAELLIGSKTQFHCLHNGLIDFTPIKLWRMKTMTQAKYLVPWLVLSTQQMTSVMRH